MMSTKQLDIRLAPARYVTIAAAAVVTGLSVKAIECKIANGTWLEGREFRRGPDGRIYVSVEGYERWVEQAPA